MYYIPQITTNDCLFTAFKILLANIKDDERYLYLQEEEKHGAYSLLEIIEKAKTYGVTLLGFEATSKNELVQNDNYPIILNIKKENQGLHSVVVYKVTSKYVYYLDSNSGKVKLSLEKFLSMWDMTGLMVTENLPSEVEPKTINLSTKKNPLNRVFQALSAVSLVLGIYFIDEVSHILIPISLLVLGLVFEVVNKVIQIKDMKRFDNETMEYLKEMKPKFYMEFLPRREKLKTSLFSSKNNFLFYFLCCAFVIFVMLLNNPLNIACVFVPIILAVLQSLVIVPVEKRKNIEVELLEVKFQREKSSLNAGKTLREIQDNAYKFVFFEIIKNSIGVLLFFLSAIVTLIALKGFDLINMFFLVFTEVFLYQNLNPIFSYEARKIEEKYNYMKFINLLQ
ncbi:MAG: cysteine peptidase family C39 domain-containing protein [Bacilli bacterium]|nr:cysteine peptidase family C39 domain-containing protein [Bacilli bacterium]